MDRKIGVQTVGQNFSPFYRTLSPIGAAAQKPMLLHTAAYLLFVANARLAGLSPDLSCLQLDLPRWIRQSSSGLVDLDPRIYCLQVLLTCSLLNKRQEDTQED